MHRNICRLTFVAASVLALSACQTPSDISPEQGALIGAGTGAVAGAATSGGVIAPAVGAVGGAIVGEEAAENDPIFD